jgi:hypothetical protein
LQSSIERFIGAKSTGGNSGQRPEGSSSYVQPEGAIATASREEMEKR